MKNTIIFLIVCFVAAGWWQHAQIVNFLKNNVNFTWLSFDETDYAATRVAYMQKGEGPVKIACISPDDIHSFANRYSQDAINGATLAAELVAKKNVSGRKIELIVTPSGQDNDTVNRSILSLGKDPGVLAVILPYSADAKVESEVFAEALELMIFHIGHLFVSREKESYLAFNNTYPVDLFSKKIAMYGDRRGLKSVLMLTEKNSLGEGVAKNQEFWFSKAGIPVPTGFLYEKNMINGPMIKELNKKIGIFGIDSVYWGSALGTHLSSIGHTIKQLHSTIEQSEHLMVLPVVADNDPLIKERLALLESSSHDPVIAYPVIHDVQQKTEFDRLYFEKYKTKANHAAYYGYDTLMLLADCIMKDSTTSPAEIAQRLTTNSYEGILAMYRFNEDGRIEEQAVDNIKLGKVQNGALVELDVEKIKPDESRKPTQKNDTFSLDQ